jgi:FKBP-type peptidyl-prolyl cis-trans isomerase FkpA
MKYIITIVIALVFVLALRSGCSRGQPVAQIRSPSSISIAEPLAPPQANVSKVSPIEVNRAGMVDVLAGTGDVAITGKKVTIDCVGWLTSGVKFDSSIDRKKPFRFILGANQVIAGMDQGVIGMKVGGKRRITIPPALGYGEKGAGKLVPPNATLLYEVRLLKVE